MSKRESPSVLKVFFNSKKGSMSGRVERPLNDDISMQLKGIGSHLERLQERIDSQHKVIRSLLKELDK